MTQEDKELLLRYLSMALPYNVAAKANYETDPAHHNLHNYTVVISGYVDGINQIEFERVQVIVSGFTCELDGVKPYLKPMSSMTEEEDKERIQLGIWRSSSINGFEVTKITPHDYEGYNSQPFQKALAFLLKNHFDIFGLIPKGLAIEVTEENNPYKD